MTETGAVQPPSGEPSLEERLLIVTPTGRDAQLTRELLAKISIETYVCSDVERMCDEVKRGAAGVLVAEEVLTPTTARQLLAVLELQPPWSDLPIILFTGANSEVGARPQTGQLLRTLGNVTLLDRPLRPITMVSTARAALRARRRQYEARNELVRQQTAVRQRDQFLAMLSHELRNPLGSIVLAADTLEVGEGDHARRVEIIRRQAKHLTQLVDDLLDVSRVTTGKVVLRQQRVDFNDLTARVVRSVEETGRTTGLRVSLRRAETPVYVDGDPVRLEQVIGNLVMNAIKYTQVGGRIEVILERSEREVTVRVRDNGVGIAAEVLPHVFELFAQADNSLDRSRGGLGIGLTVVRALVDLHGGRIEAHSDGIGRGSEFVLTLPLTQMEPVMEAPPTAPSPAAKRHHRILVVEDNEDARDLMQMVLESYGHEVEVAIDGPEGVERARQMRPNVALVDIGLPGLTGFDVARHVRAELGDDVVLIALSGYGMAEDRRQARESGFDLHYMKPVDSARLRRLLSADPDDLLRRRRVGELLEE